MEKRLLNFVLYQVAWFAVLIGAARGMAWLGAAVATLAVAIHILAWRDSFELKLVGACLVAGVLVDGALALSGQVQYAHWSLPFAPFWMLALWAAFATTLNHSMRWLMTRPAVAALTGAVGGPLAYVAGERLGALELTAAPTSLVLIALLGAPALGGLSLMVSRGAPMPAAARVPA